MQSYVLFQHVQSVIIQSLRDCVQFVVTLINYLWYFSAFLLFSFQLWTFEFMGKRGVGLGVLSKVPKLRSECDQFLRDHHLF